MMRKNIAYTLKRNSRSRSLRISVRSDGTCVVTAPRRVSRLFIDGFVQSKADWIEKATVKMKQRTSLYSWCGTTAELKKFKSSALRLAQDRLEYFNQFYGFKWTRIGIRNQKTRWGSCSTTGRISFSYKICLLPPHLADYIIVHELCHLGEMNHSPRFWALVARALPEYRRLKRELVYGNEKS